MVGVSKDSQASHRKFRDKLDLPFVLLADEERTMVSDYGVLKEKKLYGKTYMGIERTTFLIDGDGRILKIWPKVKVEGHAEAVLTAIREASR